MLSDSKIRIFIILLILLGFLTSAYSQSTYYVDNISGSDQNNGLSSNSAWRTIQKVNLSSFIPGDSILFRCDGVWTQRLRPHNSGTTGNPVVFSSYGTGAKPKFDIAESIDNGIEFFCVNHIIIDNLEITGNCHYGIWIDDADYITVKNCYIHHISVNDQWHGIVLNNIPAYTKILNNEISHCGSEAIYGDSENIEIAYNFIHNINLTGTNGDCIHLNLRATNFYVHNNILDHSNSAGPKGVFICSHGYNGDVSSYSNGIFEYNICIGGPGDDYIYGSTGMGETVRYNTMVTEFGMEESKCVKASGIIHNNNISGFGIAVYARAAPADIYNNTIVNCLMALDVNTEAYFDISFKNNILSGISYRYYIIGNNINFQSSNNLFGSDHISWYYKETGVTNLNDLKLFNIESNSLYGTPQFLDESNEDYRLLGNSPAIDAGTDVGIIHDIDSNMIPFNHIPDIGAYEFVIQNPSDTLPYSPSNTTGTAPYYHQIVIFWNDNSDNEYGYEIERSNTSQTGYTKIRTTYFDDTTYTDTELLPETTYFYRVRAYNNIGYSNYSNEVSVTTPPIPPPDPPSLLSASNIKARSLSLSWSDNSFDEINFELERALSTDSIYSTIATPYSNQTAYIDVNLTPLTAYLYRIRACSQHGCSDYSNELGVSTRDLIPPDSAPSNLTVLEKTKNTVELYWKDNSSNEDGFYIYRSLYPDSGFAFAVSSAANTTQRTDSNLTYNTTYYYKIRAFNEDGYSEYSDEISVTTLSLMPPAAPGLLSVTNVSATSVDLSWEDRSDNETGFVIYHSTSLNTGFTQAGTAGANFTTFQDAGLSPDTYYFFRVIAQNNDGNSGYSNEVKAKTSKLPPAVPDNLFVSNVRKTSIDLSWTDNSDDEDGFHIFRSFFPDSAYVQVATTGTNINTFHDDGLSPGTYYFYKVESFNEDGSSGYSDMLKIKTLKPQPPAAPEQLSAHYVTKHSVDLLWKDNADNEEGFYVVRSTTYDSGYAKVATLEANNTAYSHNGLDKNTLYFFKVEAFNKDGCSGYSNEIKVLTAEFILPLIPGGLSYSNITSTSVSISWIDKSDNELGFEVFRSTSLNSDYIKVDSTKANVNVFNDEGLLPNTAYYYKLRAFNDDGYSGFSNIIQIKTLFATLPVPPSSLKTDTVGCDFATISWIDNALNECGFIIERTTDTTGGSTVIIDIDSPDITGYNDTGLTPFTPYKYRVTAYNNVGLSDYSNELKIITLSDVPPEPPSSLLTSKISLNSITLKWKDNSNDETGFIVRRATSAKNNFNTISTLLADDTVFVDTNIKPNTTYYYMVIAVNYAGNSESSNTAIASTLSISESNRIWQGILVYYNFNLNSNDVINDYSDYKEPLDLAVENKSNITWKTNNSIEIISNTVIKSLRPATKVVNACKKTNEITLECWIKPALINPYRESSIMAVSGSDEDIGANLLQTNLFEMDSNLFNYSVSLTTKATATDGTPGLCTENELSYISLQHLVYVKDSNGIEKIYLDGEEVANSIRPKRFEDWKDDYFLILGNNMSMTNPWYGTYHMVAIYNTALSEEQVLINFEAGPSDNISSEFIEYDIEIFPNPSDGLFGIKIIPGSHNEIVSKTMIQVCNIMGTVIYSDIFADPCKELIKYYDLTSYPSGMYFIRIISNNSFGCERFIVR